MGDQLNEGYQRRVAIRGVGYYVPERIVTNHDLSTRIETSDEWIQTKIGIRERRFTREDEALSDLAYPAALRAIEDAGISPSAIDLIIVGSSTHDYVSGPLTSVIVKHRLGAIQAMTLDINIICAGTNYCMEIASQFLQSGASKQCLIICGETFSKLPNFFANRTSAVIFGDGAGAMVMSHLRSGRGIISKCLGSAFEDAYALYLPLGGSRKPWAKELFDAPESRLFMDGKKVYGFAVKAFVDSVTQACAMAGVAVKELDFVCSHQANQNIITEALGILGLPMSKTHMVLEQYGNIGGGSAMLSYAEAKRLGKVKPGDIVAFVGFGAGLAWGAHIVELAASADFI